ncbi:hypothetical protein Tco_1373381, partial [Tanacetum coccineum]
WKLLDSVEPKRSFISFFISTQTKDGHFALVHSRGLPRLDNVYEKIAALKRPPCNTDSKQTVNANYIFSKKPIIEMKQRDKEIVVEQEALKEKTGSGNK